MSRKEAEECSLRLTSEQVLGEAQSLAEFKIADGVKLSLNVQDEDNDLSVDELIEVFKKGTRKIDSLALEALEELKSKKNIDQEDLSWAEFEDDSEEDEAEYLLLFKEGGGELADVAEEAEVDHLAGRSLPFF